MSEPVLPEISEVARLQLKPGDGLVIRYAMPLSLDQVQRIREHVQSIIGDTHPVYVLDSGAEVSVIET